MGIQKNACQSGVVTSPAKPQFYTLIAQEDWPTRKNPNEIELNSSNQLGFPKEGALGNE